MMREILKVTWPYRYSVENANQTAMHVLWGGSAGTMLVHFQGLHLFLSVWFFNICTMLFDYWTEVMKARRQASKFNTLHHMGGVNWPAFILASYASNGWTTCSKIDFILTIRLHGTLETKFFLTRIKMDKQKERGKGKWRRRNDLSQIGKNIDFIFWYW